MNPTETKPAPRVYEGPASFLKGANISSAIDKFVNRGDETEDLILRSDFPTIDHGIAWCRMLYKAQKFSDKRLENMLMNYIAMLPAIKGKRIDILKQTVIGQESKFNKNSFWDGVKNFGKPKDANPNG